MAISFLVEKSKAPNLILDNPQAELNHIEYEIQKGPKDNKHTNYYC